MTLPSRAPALRSSLRRQLAAGAAIAVTSASLIGFGATRANAAPAICGVTGVLQIEGSYDQCTYQTPGTDVFNPPAGVSEVSAGALGAQGGSNSHQVVVGGAGEDASGLLHHTGSLFVDVGAPGGDGTAEGGGAGGTNGTTVGAGGSGGYLASAVTGGGGGGASSDVRAGSDPTTRLLVGAGGGGAGDNGGTGQVYGGAGGDGGALSPGQDGLNGLATASDSDIDGVGVSVAPAQGGLGATDDGGGAGGVAGPEGQFTSGSAPSENASGGIKGEDGKGLTSDGSAGDGGDGANGVAVAEAPGAGGGSGGGGGGGYTGGGGGGSAGTAADQAGGVGGAGGGGGGGTSFGPQFASFNTESKSGTVDKPASGEVLILFAATTPAISASASPPTAALGAPVTDSVELNGSGSAPTGSLTFGLFAASDSTCASPISGSTSTVTVSGSKTYQSSAFAPTAVGTYFWNYTYTGDVTYLGSPGKCDTGAQQLVVGNGGGGNKPPPNTFELGKPVKHPTTGTATIMVTLSDAGKLVLNGAGVHSVTKAVKKKGNVSVVISASGTALTTLNKHHKVTLHTDFTFTPSGGKANKKPLTVALTKPKPKKKKA